MRHLPDLGTRGRRAGLAAAAKRPTGAYTWGHLSEADERAERRKIDREPADLPAPANFNLIAFGRSATRLIPFAERIRETTREHQTLNVRHIVDRVVVADRSVRAIGGRLEARPFFEDFSDVVAVAPPDGLTASPSDSGDSLVYYAAI